ncbi:hypothetical protein [Macrococcus lamae]|uniref:Uncharacterized protein n=1 Tax=Macrococcus lamae TaxID=198484 RepID=A0A4V3BFB6_9STAP|nr:hypothetical protein [Macrococcus lamae]TDM13106.1 hypothetical protein ERX29_00445 [Macrococcus lamae]
MEVGIIIFIIGIIFSFFQSVIEKKNKEGKPAKAQAPKVKTLDELKKEYNKQTHKAERNTEQINTAKKSAASTASKTQVGNERKRPERKTHSIEEKMAAIMTDEHLSERQKMQRINSITENDLTENHEQLLDFSKHNLVQGIVLSEVLAPPKSKR